MARPGKKKDFRSEMDIFTHFIKFRQFYTALTGNCEGKVVPVNMLNSSRTRAPGVLVLTLLQVTLLKMLTWSLCVTNAPDQDVSILN